MDEGGAQQRRDEDSESRHKRLGTFLTTVPGIVTAVAALITAITGAFVGGTQVVGTAPRPTVTITVRVTAGSTSADSGAGRGEGSSQLAPSPSGPASLAAGTTGLWSLKPLQDFAQTTTGAAQIGTKSYPDSVQINCAYSTDDVIYDVAGYKIFRAYIGVPSNSADAAGTTATISFFKDGTSTRLIPDLTVALDQPTTVRVNLDGSSQLEIDCTASQPAGIDIAFGNATLSSS